MMTILKREFFSVIVQHCPRASSRIKRPCLMLLSISFAYSRTFSARSSALFKASTAATTSPRKATISSFLVPTNVGYRKQERDEREEALAERNSAHMISFPCHSSLQGRSGVDDNTPHSGEREACENR